MSDQEIFSGSSARRRPFGRQISLAGIAALSDAGGRTALFFVLAGGFHASTCRLGLTKVCRHLDGEPKPRGVPRLVLGLNLGVVDPLERKVPAIGLGSRRSSNSVALVAIVFWFASV
jgi:hypothetical protein